MVSFILKSAISFMFLYVYYHFFLLRIKSFYFNRFYLLYSILFSITIPFINIRFPWNMAENLQPLTFVSDFIVKENVIAGSINPGHFEITLILLYFLVTSFLMMRFVTNILKILKLIRQNEKINHADYTIVMIQKKFLPYSFFRYIFLNRSDYQEKMIREELILHEKIHCKQYHSADILMIEAVKILLWFNPIVWFFGKAIRLNHEFIADHETSIDIGLEKYQNALLNLIFRNNSSYLASNLNYSLTKKRLTMMNSDNSPKRTAYRKILASSLFVILAFFIIVQCCGKFVNC